MNRKTVIIVTIAIAIGMAIGFGSGNLCRETKMPGEAICTDDATGHWQRHAEPVSDINAEILTNTHIRLVMQALPTYALLHAGALPESLEALVTSGLLGKDIIRDGWERPFIYTRDAQRSIYSIRSLGADGLPSADDIPLQ
ncbi:MAG: type II secretion system protein GspG [Kiritimatiellia bacterium]